MSTRQDNLRIAMAQINSIVGDLEQNRRKISGYLQMAKEFGADIVTFPELALCGYPPEDLLLKPKFIQDNLAKLQELSELVGEVVVVVGFIDKKGNNLYNAAAIIHEGKIQGICHKMFLPNYGVFDERRYFQPGKETPVFRYGDVIFGVNICEDIWHIDGPTKQQASLGAKLILNINASPYYAGRIKEREKIVQQQARTNRVFIAYTNLVGGQDELVFDGQSMVVDNNGRILGRAEAFKEDLMIVDLPAEALAKAGLDIPVSNIKMTKKIVLITEKPLIKERQLLVKKEIKPLEQVAEIYQALLLGLYDYVKKNGFEKVVIGLSGGIDSSLVATLAVDALGKDNVIGVFMPSHYSSIESEEDVKKLTEKLGIKLINISIEQLYKIYLVKLEPYFAGWERDVTEENLQARIRGNILMAFSNKFGWLVLTTGNKSEMSCGYATLYGDMAGGFAVIKDVPKTLVYKLAKYRNSLGGVIPERVFTKEPTAELKPNQKDRDMLPPYEILDGILKAYVEEDKNLDEIVSFGFEQGTVNKILNIVDRNEYKRRQAPPGVKITHKAFGKDRRMPITNKYRG